MDNYPLFHQVFCIHRIFTEIKTGKKTGEIVYGITSLAQQKASPKTILKFSRGHWTIENGLHYVRATSFREDHSQIRTQNASRAMASLENPVIGLFHFLNVPNITKTLRNFAARPFLSLQMLRL